MSIDRKYKLVSINHIILSACLLGLACHSIAPANGTELTSADSRLYRTGTMESIKEDYIDLVCMQPQYYPWRYLLANAYFQLHDYNAALLQYEFCMELYPDARTASFCRLGIKNAKKCLGMPEDVSEQLGGKEFVSNLKSAKEQRRQATQLSIDNQRAKIMDEGNAKAREIRTAANDQIEAIRRNATWWYVDPTKNDLVPVVSPALEQSIKDRADARAEALIKRAQNKAAELQAPESDEVIEGLLSQTRAGSRYSSVRLLPFGSNIYVRNYGHRSNNFALSGLSGTTAH